jgi:formylglycine-generating enzyme required for sulfatase activity
MPAEIKKQIHTQQLPNGFSFNLISIEGGTFMMGSDDKNASNFEKPRHQVTVPSFHLAEYPVTQALWMAVMKEANPSLFKGNDHPVEKVSW